MILKTTFRLIKSTLNRFIAILAIVFIGVSFMMGLRSNYNIMQNSVEKYDDESKLYDFQIYSNFGFDENDARAIKNLDYVEDVYASRTRDVYSKAKGQQGIVTRILELDSNLNTIELKEGRMPEKENECLVIQGYSSFGSDIGDTFTIYLENEEVSDSFKNTTFNVVGVAKSSENMTETFSTSTLDSKDLNTIVYIPNSNFISDYYTCMYISIEGARELFSFSDEYKNLIDEKETLLSDFSKNQSQELKNSILEEANKQLDEAKLELEENRTKYEKELADGKAKLDDAKIQLDDAKRQIEEGEAQIPASEKALKDGEAQIASGEATLKEKEQELNAAIAQVEGYGMSMDQLQSTVTGIYNQYVQAENNVNNLTAQRDQVNAQLQAQQAIIDASGCSSSQDARYKKQLINPEAEDYAEQIAYLDSVISAFDYVKAHSGEVSSLERQILVNQATMTTIDATMQRTVGMDTKSGYSYVVGAISQIKSGQQQIKQGYADLEAAKAKVSSGYAELEAGKRKLEEGKVEYQKGLAEYESGLKEYNDGLKEFEKQMQDAQDQIEDAEEQLNSLSEVSWYILKRYNTNYSYYMYANTCEQMKNIGTIIPILFFVVAALVCSTTMTRLIDEQRGQIGIYSALGFTKFEISSIYLLYVIIASLAASIVAVVVGVYLFPTIIYTTWRLLYDLPTIQISMPIDNLLLCISCFTVLMMAVTSFVLHGTLKDSSAQLLRPKAPKNAKQIILEKWHWLWSKLTFTSKVTARNLLRYKARFIMTVIGVAGCTSLLVMGFGIKDSIGGVIELQYTEITRYNQIINIKNDRHIDEIIEEIEQNENNEVCVPYMTYQSPIYVGDKDSSTQVTVLDQAHQQEMFGLKSSKTDKEILLNNEGIFINDKFAKSNNLSIGDTVRIKSLDGTEAEVRIENTIVNYVGSAVYMSEDYYYKTFKEGIEYNTIGVTNNTDPETLQSLTSKFNDVKSVSDFSAAISSFNDMFDALNLIIIVIILVAGALAFVVLINLTNVNISERIREIATLKVLGFREHEVDSYIFKEVLLMTIVGAIIGLPIGNVEEAYIMTEIDMDLCTFPHIVHPISYVYSFLITIGFTIIVLFLTRKTLRKVEMVESLKSIE